jgi:hypothetical protein
MPVSKLLRKAGKTLLVVTGCVCAGFIVGTLAHYVGLGHYFGWNLDALRLALLEGGWPGGALGFLVAVPIYYLVLHGHASAKEWALLVCVTFVAATVTAPVVSALTVVITPIATLTTAVIMRSK